ncbi:MAG: Cell division protein ftsA [Parcubacteria group bacterium GW2011_GWA1_59_11]|nr:MAG: Cell division protein ftsA [Parcubacteria group bacterium GW2011_GWA1_59_11]
MKLGTQYVVGLDIGTASVKVAVAENRSGKPALRAVFKEPSGGMRKGAIVDLAEAAGAVAKAVAEVRKVAKAGLKTIYVNIGTHQVKGQSSKGIVAVSRADSEIYQDDIDRVIRGSQAVNLAPNRMIVHNVTREYIVDGAGDILDPLGLSGNRLEVSSLVVDAFAPHVKSVMRVVELAGGRVGGMVIDPLAAARSVLTKNQRDLGTVLVEIGAGTTSVAVYEENKLQGVSVLPVGAGNITNDLAVGLRLPVPAAENLKLNYGHALAGEVNAKESVDLRKFSPEAKGMVSRRFVAEIIESRLAEIFDLVNNELRLWGKFGQLAGGAVLTGGGAKMPGVTDLAKQVLKLSTQIGFSSGEEWSEETAAFSEAFEDPEFVTALGLVLWGADKEHWQLSGRPTWSKAKQIWRYFLP